MSRDRVRARSAAPSLEDCVPVAPTRGYGLIKSRRPFSPIAKREVIEPRSKIEEHSLVALTSDHELFVPHRQRVRGASGAIGPKVQTQETLPVGEAVSLGNVEEPPSVDRLVVANLLQRGRELPDLELHHARVGVGPARTTPQRDGEPGDAMEQELEVQILGAALRIGGNHLDVEREPKQQALGIELHREEYRLVEQHVETFELVAAEWHERSVSGSLPQLTRVE